MEVVLKKSKITKSIIDQSLRGLYSLYYSWDGYEILGWVGIKKSKEYYRWTLLYKKATQQIIKIPYIDNESRIKIVKKSKQLRDGNQGWIFPELLYIQISFPDRFSGFENHQDYPTETDEEMNDKFEKLKEHIRIVNEKGQIYI